MEDAIDQATNHLYNNIIGLIAASKLPIGQICLIIEMILSEVVLQYKKQCFGE